ncbi:hypothetical protein Hanom_Chr08g00713041 [Helianthus anomalus]
MCFPVVVGRFGRLWRRRTYYVRHLCFFLPLALNLFICVDGRLGLQFQQSSW